MTLNFFLFLIAVLLFLMFWELSKINSCLRKAMLSEKKVPKYEPAVQSTERA
jgi:hypothetical protein